VLLTIGELAERTGMATSALRYYEELGLLRPRARVSGHRRYDETAVGVVGAVLLLRDVGFTLGEIDQFMAARVATPGAWRDLARRKLDELDDRIARAEAARVALQHALACRHEDVVECPMFRRVVRARLAGLSLADAHDHR